MRSPILLASLAPLFDDLRDFAVIPMVLVPARFTAPCASVRLIRSFRVANDSQRVHLRHYVRRTPFILSRSEHVCALASFFRRGVQSDKLACGNVFGFVQTEARPAIDMQGRLNMGVSFSVCDPDLLEDSTSGFGSSPLGPSQATKSSKFSSDRPFVSFTSKATKTAPAKHMPP